jgi:hypothetical protein
MKKIYFIAACVMAAYFALAILIIPKVYENAPTFIPQPRLDVKISSQKIILGESFEITILASNQGDAADLQIASVAFPQNNNLDNIQIVSYDFLQSPQLIQKGETIGSEYLGGTSPVLSKYPFIEAYSRPANHGDSFAMTLKVTPTETGSFRIYTKSVTMPHTNNLSHFPAEGLLDHQNEFVQEHIVDVVNLEAAS